MPESPSRHVLSFDALRGLAALSVMLSHYVLTLGRSHQNPAPRLLAALRETPLGVLWAGRSAVLLFFVLSGYVLFIMLENPRAHYLAYAVKRILRLYLPYAFAVILGMIGAEFAYSGALHGVSGWINQFWTKPPSVRSAVRQLTVVGTFDTNRYDFTIWTLVQEMRISLIFPVIALFVRTRRAWQALWPFVILSVAAAAVHIEAVEGHITFFGLAGAGGFTAFSFTVFYLLAFALGAALAHHREPLCAWYRRLGAGTRVALAVASFLVYCYGPQLASTLGHHLVIRDWPALAASAMGLIIAAYDTSVAAVLQSRPLLYLGRISYSLYLLHPIILLAALHCFSGVLPLPLLLLAALIATLVATDLAYRFVERPAIELARKAPRSPLIKHCERQLRTWTLCGLIARYEPLVPPADPPQTGTARVRNPHADAGGVQDRPIPAIMTGR